MKYLLIASAITAADQLTKRWAERRFKDGDKAKKGKICLQNVRNSGAAMGIFADRPRLLTALTVFSALQVCASYYKLYKDGKLDDTYKFSAVCIFGGAAGNIIDRARRGYVTDFIQVGNSPVFNIADVFVSVGVIMFMTKRFFAEYIPR